MEETTDVQKLEKISTEVIMTEVDESQYKIILSSQCIKAQAYLTAKLHKQSEQQKQVCNFINNGNFKLEMEIKLAEDEVKRSLSALDTIKTANVELKKELLSAKEKKNNVIERVRNGIKKYEELWVVSKRRYESIPFIQNYLQVKNKSKILQDNILNLNNELIKISNDINIRKNETLHLDREYIIEVAKFMINERPKILQKIYEKNEEIKVLSNNIQEILNKGYTESFITELNTTTIVESNKNEPMATLIESSWPNLSTDIDCTMRLPKLQLQNTDLDMLTVKLDQIKKVDSQSSLWKRTESEKSIALEIIPLKKVKADKMVNDLYVSSYFQTRKTTEEQEKVDCQSKNYSKKKLIHILEDIKLDRAETFNIISKVKESTLKDVNMIKAEVAQNDLNSIKLSQEKKCGPIESEEIEEVDMSQNEPTNILVPPSQFLDLTQEGIENSRKQNKTQSDILPAKTNFKNNSQERRVTFDAVVSVRNSDSTFDLDKCQENETVIDNSPNNQLNISTTSDDSYIKIKETIFKKHNLDLSPQFTYTKNISIPERSETNIVSSKFFNDKINDNTGDKNIVQVMDIDDDLIVEKVSSQQVQNEEANNIPETENTEITGTHKNTTVAGLLFTHGPQGISDSLDVSISTTGYEDMDSDMPQFIDSNLLLSPKAEVHMPNTSDNDVEVLSQEVPNFLSGIKKTGFSFFASTSPENTDAEAQNPRNNFTFSFGGNEKKSRGGLFSMFR